MEHLIVKLMAAWQKTTSASPPQLINSLSRPLTVGSDGVCFHGTTHRKQQHRNEKKSAERRCEVDLGVILQFSKQTPSTGHVPECAERSHGYLHCTRSV